MNNNQYDIYIVMLYLNEPVDYRIDSKERIIIRSTANINISKEKDFLNKLIEKRDIEIINESILIYNKNQIKNDTNILLDKKIIDNKLLYALSNKKVLSKLLKLNNRNADKFLSEFAIKLKKEISNSRNNEDIYNKLELLEEFMYKEPKITLEIIQHIIYSKPNKPKIHRYRSYKTTGKKYSDLVFKSLEMLNEIRYANISNVFKILVDLRIKLEDIYSSKIDEIIKNISQYNLNALKVIGYTAQETIVKEIKNWNIKKRLENIKIINIVSQELLEPSFQGIKMASPDKITLSSGPLNPTNSLKRIRLEIINLLTDIYKQAKDIKIKIKILKTLSSVSEYPIHEDKKTKSMIFDHTRYLINIYKKFLFDKNNKLIVKLPIVAEIERQLIWLKEKEFRIPEINKILKQINKDKFYDLYKTLLTDNYSIHITDYTKLQKQLDYKINITVESIDKNNLGTWNQNLNKLALYARLSKDHETYNFSNLIRKISTEKYELADKILDKNFNKDSLTYFIRDFLIGFRNAKKIDLYDKYINKIIESKDIKLISLIPISVTSNVTKNDLVLLKQIIGKKDQFDFLKKIDKDNLTELYMNTIRSLAYSYKNYTEEVSKLIIKIMKMFPERIKQIFYELSFAQYRETTDILKWKQADIDFILKEIIKIDKLDHDVENLIEIIANKYFDKAMNLFIDRINYKPKKQNYLRYDPIPANLSSKLHKIINKNHKQFEKIAFKWIQDMEPKWTHYGWELSHFLQLTGGVKKIIQQLIQTGKKTNLQRALQLLDVTGPADLKTCLEIVKKTDDKKLLKQVRAIMYKTGIVSGDFGIAEAYKSKIRYIQKYRIQGTKEEKKRFQIFKKDIVKSLEQSEKKERQRAQEEIKLREIDFEDK